MKLRPRTWIILGAAAVIALACAWWNACGGKDIVLPQADLQQRINDRLPIETKHDLTISRADIDLTGDKLGLAVKASAVFGHTTYSVDAETRGQLTYNNHEGAFYFHPEALKVNEVNSFKGTLQGTASTFLSNLAPVQKLKAGKDHLLTEGAQLMQAKVQEAASVALDRLPVYKLPDNLKGHVVYMALSSVEIKNGAIIAHMSFLQFTGLALLYAGVFVLVLVIGAGLVVAAANGAELPFFFII